MFRVPGATRGIRNFGKARDDKNTRPAVGPPSLVFFCTYTQIRCSSYIIHRKNSFEMSSENILSFGKSLKSPEMHIESEIGIDEPTQTFDDAFDSQHSPTDLMGQLPNIKERILDEEIQKMDYEGFWNNRRLIMTSTDLVLTRIGEDVVRDSIPLHEIERIQTIDSTLAHSGLHGNEHLILLRKDKLSDLLGEDEARFDFEIYTAVDGYNSGITYKMRTVDAQTRTRIVSAINVARDKRKRRIRRQMGYSFLSVWKLRLR